MPILQLEPLDTLFFRDGKPFTMGEDTFVTSSNLPYPSVFWGAIFTSLLVQQKIGLCKMDKDKLRINGVYLYNEKRQEVYLHAPLDLFINKEHKAGYDSNQYSLVENPHFKTNKANLSNKHN